MLFVTARDDEIDRVVGLEIGADDYITKLFSPREVVARVSGVLRRARAADTSAPLLRTDRLIVDVSGRKVTVDDREVPLTATEFDLLAYLMRRPSTVFTRDQLLSNVWDMCLPRVVARSMCILPRCGQSSARPARSARCVRSGMPPTPGSRPGAVPRRRRVTNEAAIAPARGSLSRRITVLAVGLVVVTIIIGGPGHRDHALRCQ